MIQDVVKKCLDLRIKKKITYFVFMDCLIKWQIVKKATIHKLVTELCIKIKVFHKSKNLFTKII